MNGNTFYARTAFWLAFALTLSPGHAQTQEAAATFVTVNGEAQSTRVAEVLLREQLARGAANSPELQAAVKDSLIRQTLMAQEASKEGLDRQPVVQAQIALTRQSILAQAWQQKFLQEVRLQEEDIKAEYERQIRLLGLREYRIRHILVQEEATAKLLLEKVSSGTSIADMAAEYSRDQATRSQGGLTEWTSQGLLLPTIGTAVEGLQPGQWVPVPVASPAGWHVVQLDQSRPYVAPDIEKVRPQLVQALRQQRLQEKLSSMVSSAKIE